MDFAEIVELIDVMLSYWPMILGVGRLLTWSNGRDE